MNDQVQHAQARREAVGWYTGFPPMPDAAHEHFSRLKRRHPENAACYDEALRIFLARYAGVNRYP